MQTTEIPLRPFEAYRPASVGWDELQSAQGVRPHWDFVRRSLDALGLPELCQRKEELALSLKQSGVTYNITEDLSRKERAWSLDLIPVVYDSREWNRIERGLLQRAELLDLILNDAYGPRDLIRRGLLPAEVILAHPGFLRPCLGLPRRGAHQLTTIAVDLARQPDGNMVVIAHRAQAPSGAGYALENRIALSRILPSAYRDAQVHRLAGYFRTMRNTLNELARGRDEPRIVLLTPGPDSETYFEHAFLASYLGITLVQGGDLTVRQGRIYLRTLDGLEAVDVVLRRLDDIFCDPLELRPDSLLGTPGMLQAARLGAVAIANPPGAGVLDNPALMPYLPALCRALLGQDLLLPGVETWWCGDDAGRQYVLDHLNELIVKPIFPRPGKRAIFPAQISENARRQLRERIAANPYLYVGQAEVQLSRTPQLTDRGLEGRPMILRTFTLSRGEDFMVMPGGLTRVSSSPESSLVSNQKGGISKDTWVLASEPMRESTMLRSAAPAVEINRAGGSVASRVADNLYWLGRYVERAELQTRALREAVRELTNDEARLSTEMRAILFGAVATLCNQPAGELRNLAANRSDLEIALLDLIYSGERTGSLSYNIAAARHAGRSVQDRLSDDGWKFLNMLGERLENRASHLAMTLPTLDGTILALAAFSGIAMESMIRGPGWRFLDLGRRVERAVGALSLLQSLFFTGVRCDEAMLETALSLKDSLRSYRRRYQLRLQSNAVVDLLLFDESNPQAAGYQLARIQEHVDWLHSSGDERRRARYELLALEAQAALRLSESGEDAEMSPALGELILRLSGRLQEFSDALAERYFAHAVLPQQM